MSDERWQRLMESPLDDDGPRPLRWIAAGLGLAVVLGAAVFLLRGDEVAPPPTATTSGAAPAAATTEPVATTGSSAVTEPTAQPGPAPRVLYEAVYEPGSGQVLVVGGAEMPALGRPGEALAETWGYDPATGGWTDHSAGMHPSGRAGHALAVDGAAGVVVLFGGADVPRRTCGVSGPCPQEALGDTWTFDAAAGRWSQQQPSRAPSPRYGAAMAYDEESQMLVLFGGAVRSASSFVNDPLGDTWTYDVATDTWTELSPAASPPARAWHRMAYDPGRDRILMFGGGAPGEADGLVWAYDANANSWESFTATAPAARWGAAVAFDQQSDRLVVVGGEGPVVRSLGEAGTATTIDFLADVWVFDPATDSWEGRNLLEHPTWWIAGAWDPGTDRIVTLVFDTTGSYDTESDTWAFDDPPDVG